MYFQGLILEIFSFCMQSDEVKLLMIYKNRLLGSISQASQNQHKCY